MSDKKENILQVALELFANEGYNAVATSKIAKQAGVSEGLIFKHFTNKQGLLEALIAAAEKRMAELMAPVIFETDPKAVIRKSISLAFDIDPAEYNFWRLQFKLKWEQAYYHPHKMKPITDKLIWAFESLAYEQAKQEALLLNHIIESLAIGILRDGIASQMEQKDFLLKKYKV